MKVGIPKGLLYCKYHPFFENFFYELGAEIITSPETNKDILDIGVKYCVDEACLPVKVFHGHAAYLKDKCDIMLIPRIMQVRKDEFICPKFCGLPEMIINDIPDMPEIIEDSIYSYPEKKLYKWALRSGKKITKNIFKIKNAYDKAQNAQKKYSTGINDKGYEINAALVGHPYNIYDSFINMNVVKKLNKIGIGIITEEFAGDEDIDAMVGKLYKRPFWTFARNSYGFSTFAKENGKFNGIVYISSFACGIDSVIIDLIKNKIGDFPLLVLKIDEHTGEAGFDTRIEAFADMLKRSCDN